MVQRAMAGEEIRKEWTPIENISEHLPRAMWVNELTEMRERMRDLRKQLSDALNVQGGEVMAAAVKNQNGMFSTLPLSVDQARKLRSDYSIYMTDSGRINIAGANAENIPRLAESILAVL